MIAVVTGRPGSALEQALCEEDPTTLVVTAGSDLEAVARRCRGRVDAVVPATSGAIRDARRLARMLDISHETDAVVTWLTDGAPRASRPSAAAQRDSEALRLSTDVVSLRGRHLVAGIAEEIWKDTPTGPRLRSRLSLAHDTDLARNAAREVVALLDEVGLQTHATHSKASVSIDGAVRVLAVSGAPPWPATPIDAAFSAFGMSVEHLIVESILRGHEFDRRLARPPLMNRAALGCTYIWGAKRAVSAEALRVVRRLPGFHSLTGLPQPGGERTSVATVTFAHRDRELIRSSQLIVSELIDSGALHAGDFEFMSYATVFH